MSFTTTYIFEIKAYTLVFCLCICLSCIHTCLKCHSLHSQVRMYFGSLWVETDWKETLPRRQLSQPPTAKTYKRTESVFVQVFHIGPVPDIFLNETKWQTIFFHSEGSSQIPGSSDAWLTSQEFLYCATPVALHYFLQFLLPGCKHSCIVNSSLMDIYDRGSHRCYYIFDATNEASTTRPPAPRFI